MHSNKILLSLFLGLMMSSVWAEPALKEGDTLESLSQVRIETRIHPTAEMMVQPHTEAAKAVMTQQQNIEAQENMVSVEEIDAPVIE